MRAPSAGETRAISSEVDTGSQVAGDVSQQRHRNAKLRQNKDVERVSDSTGSETALDHDDFGLNPSEVMNVIDSRYLERDASGKPVPGLPHRARVALRAHAWPRWLQNAKKTTYTLISC
jgi:hypothetical protein